MEQHHYNLPQVVPEEEEKIPQMLDLVVVV
jgi:hypothetical protein